MDIPEAKFRVGLDRSPLGSTVVIEVYGREESQDLGYLREVESIQDVLESNSEEEDFPYLSKSVFEFEPEEYRFRFEIDSEERWEYEQVFRDAVASKDPEFDSVDDALYTVEIFTSPNHGIGKEIYLERFDRDKVPGDVIKAFSSLHRAAYENIID